MRVLGVGVATVDLVTTVARYPRENSEVRADARRIARGGNATNTLAVLGQLGHRCSWIGTLADDSWSQLVRDALAREQVDCRLAVTHPGTATPLSSVVVAREGGSRTIVHYRDLPELTAAQFAAVDPDAFDWIHFEGRNPVELRPMLERVRAAAGVRCSLEVEKPRAGIEPLLGCADLLLCSGDYARSRGREPGPGFLQALRDRLPAGAMATVSDGVRGAWGIDPAGNLLHAAAVVPAQVIDTLGAGDVFNAAVIDAVARGGSLDAALAAGCVLAGRKCGRSGLQGLVDG